MLAVLLLRRIAYTLLAIFRAASRSDEGCAMLARAPCLDPRRARSRHRGPTRRTSRDCRRHTLKSPGSQPAAGDNAGT